MDIQRNLEANVEKRTKDTYGPPMGKRLLVFMDDMNMPKVVCRSKVQGGAGRAMCLFVCCVCSSQNGKMHVFILQEVCRAQVTKSQLSSSVTGMFLYRGFFPH